jgi:hypothetical protein
MRAGAKQQQPSDKKYVRHYMMFQSIAVSQTPIKALLHLILTPLPPPLNFSPSLYSIQLELSNISYT